MRLRRLTIADLATAVLILGASLALLLSSADTGFSRDESFYYDYSRTYQRWFKRLESATGAKQRKEVLSKTSVDGTWNQNFEHPPLMKVLFGWSWRAFGEKHRDASWSSGDGTVVVTGLAPTDGFAKDALVELTRPSRLDPTGRTHGARRLAEGRVVKRSPSRAVLRLEAGAPKDQAEWKALCSLEADRVMRGCSAHELRASYWLSEIDAFRFPAMVFSAILLALIYLFGAQTLSRGAGLLGAATFLLIPRQFFHAHLLCFDVPIVTMVFATLYAFLLSERSRAWAVGVAVIWGLALLTKHNAFFIPIALVLYWAISRWRQFRVNRGRLEVAPFPMAFLLMPPIGVTLLVALWPALWYEPFRSLAKYLAFHLKHAHYLQYYFGDILAVPPHPFAFPFVLTLFTVPAVIVLAFTWGVVAFSRPSSGISRGIRVFYLVNLIVPVLVIAAPSTPVFGGVKHWMTAMPFFCLLAGHGVLHFSRKFAEVFAPVLNQGAYKLSEFEATLRQAMTALMVTLLLAASIFQLVDNHPQGTAYWNEWMGGIQGGAKSRVQRQFWGYATLGALPWLNRNVAKRGGVYYHNATCSTAEMYKREGLLRDDIRCAYEPNRAAASTFHHQKSFSEVLLEIRNATDRLSADYVSEHHGVALVSVFTPRVVPSPLPEINPRAIPSSRLRRPAFKKRPGDPTPDFKDGAHQSKQPVNKTSPKSPPVTE